ncbi:paraquat-inducible protein A, partial [Enterobacter intestinihominis]
VEVCPRCDTKGQVRRKHCLQWTMGLLVCSVMVYLPAYILEMMFTDVLGDRIPSTIVAAFILLSRQRSYLSLIPI